VHTAGGKGLQEFLGTKLLLLLVLGGKVARVVDDDALLGPGAGVSLYVLINLVVHKAWIPSFKLKPKDVSFSEGWATRAFGLDAFDIPTWLSLVEKYLRVSRAIPTYYKERVKREPELALLTELMNALDAVQVVKITIESFLCEDLRRRNVSPPPSCRHPAPLWSHRGRSRG